MDKLLLGCALFVGFTALCFGVSALFDRRMGHIILDTHHTNEKDEKDEKDA